MQEEKEKLRVLIEQTYLFMTRFHFRCAFAALQMKKVQQNERVRVSVKDSESKATSTKHLAIRFDSISRYVQRERDTMRVHVSQDHTDSSNSFCA